MKLFIAPYYTALLFNLEFWHFFNRLWTFCGISNLITHIKLCAATWHLC